jgi:two-component system, cell cycle response regulator DivK
MIMSHTATSAKSLNLLMHLREGCACTRREALLNAPIILGIDENREHQLLVAQTFNERGIFYRFISDRKKLLGGIKQLNPNLLLICGELSADFVIQCIDTISHSVEYAALPVVVISHDASDAQFVHGFRTGVVGQLQGPFTPQHVEEVVHLYGEVASRAGTVEGQGATGELGAFLEHVRRTRRTGMLHIFQGQPNEGRAIFANGKLERSRYSDRSGSDALHAMAAVSTPWTFSEVAGAQGDGAGVVIEVGGDDSNETEVEVAQVRVDENDIAPTFEMKPTPVPQAKIITASHVYSQPKILLVDDDEAILRMFSTLFAKRGFLVTTAGNGQLGAELALKTPFDLIMTDLNMPQLDGWGMLRVLRDDLRTKEVPVAFISAHDDYRESLKAVEAGAQAFLSKGAKLDAIVEQVRTLLNPRALVADSLGKKQPFELSIHTVGPQWLLLTIAEKKLDGVLKGKDGWSEFTLVFSAGSCVHASAIAGKYTAQGDRAFNAFVSSRAATGDFAFGSQNAPQNLFHDTKALIERACTTLNANEQKLRDQKLISGADFDVNQQLYDIYRQVGPAAWLPMAKMICEDKVAPRSIIEQLDVSPVDVEETLKDLVRRGVVVFKK